MKARTASSPRSHWRQVNDTSTRNTPAKTTWLIALPGVSFKDCLKNDNGVDAIVIRGITDRSRIFMNSFKIEAVERRLVADRRSPTYPGISCNHKRKRCVLVNKANEANATPPTVGVTCDERSLVVLK